MTNPYTQFITPPPEETSENPYTKFVENERPVETTPKAKEHVKSGEWLGTFASSVLPSIGHAVEGFAHMVTHPVETAKTMGSMASGFISKTGRPGDLLRVGDEGPNEAELARRKRDEAATDALFQFYRDRYGSWQDVSDTIARDPFGFFLDASTALSGVGGGLRAVSGLPGATRAANIASKAGRITNPMTPLMKGVEMSVLGLPTGLRNIAGVTTGVGGDALGEAFQTARNLASQGPGSPGYQAALDAYTRLRDAMKQKLSPEETVALAREAIATMKENASKAYTDAKSGPGGWEHNTTTLNFAPIRQAWADQYATLFSKGTGLPKADKGQIKRIEELGELITEWENNPAAHTLMGLDDLKQAIQNFSNTPEQRQVHRVSTALANEVKRITLAEAQRHYGTRNNPYSTSLKEYESFRNTLEEMEKSLGLGKKASIDSTSRKLLSVMRNNVNTNFGQRAKNVERLELAGDVDLMPEIAGHALSAGHPRGIASAGASTIAPAVALGGAGTINPWALAALPFTFALASPRLMGETAVGLGRGVGTAERLLGPTASKVSGAYGRFVAPHMPSEHARNLGLGQLSTLAEEGEPKRRGGAIRRYAGGGDVTPQQPQGLPDPASFWQQYGLPSAFAAPNAPDRPRVAPKAPEPPPLLSDMEIAPQENLVGQMAEIARKFAKKPDPTKPPVPTGKREPWDEKPDGGPIIGSFDNVPPSRGAGVPAAPRAMSPMQGPDTGEPVPDSMPFVPNIPGDYFAKLRGAESAGNDSAVNRGTRAVPGTNASGRFQFLPGTWAEYGRLYPELGLTPQNILDPEKQNRAVEKYTERSRDRITQMFNRPPTNVELYMMHWFGHSGGEAVLRHPGSKLGDLLDPVVFEKNPNIRPTMTAAELMATIAKTWG